METKNFIWGSKAETLEWLRARLSESKVLPSLVFSVADWSSDQGAVIERIQKTYPRQKLVVRSSAKKEDSAQEAFAGVYDSVIGVDSGSADRISSAISEVAKSYLKICYDPQNQIFVQSMLTDVSMSGVVFTCDINTGAPYYVVNYDDISGKTDTITSGIGDHNRTLYVYREGEPFIRSSRFQTLIRSVKEVEEQFPGIPLDVEFGMDRDESVYIFQVRPMTAHRNWDKSVAGSVGAALDGVCIKLESRFKRADYPVLGKKSVFTEMSDWNPAEMIGPVPRALARSLYETLITDRAWAQARLEMGYRDMTGVPLMTSFGGRPYIDVRNSFNSFIPGDLPAPLAERLVDYYIDRLENNPAFHDKVEFEVALTCLSFDFDKRHRPMLLEHGFSDEEVAQVRKSLAGLTRNAMNEKMIREQYGRIQLLVEKRKDYSSLPAKEVKSVVRLLEDCRAFGTVPFSILARCAFIAEESLRSLVRLGVLTEERVLAFKATIQTVLGEFLEATHELQDGKISASEFMSRFGHLRPGTYDILSLRYDQRFSNDPNFGKGDGSREKARAPAASASHPQGFELTEREKAKIDSILAKESFAISSAELLAFLRGSIVGREFAKFEFTHNISEALEMLAGIGAVSGLDRESLSHLAIQDILARLSGGGGESAGQLRQISGDNKMAYSVSQALRLPFMMASVGDAKVVPLLKAQPNFVTQKKVQGNPCFLSGDQCDSNPLAGKIVLIEGADPGYDWIFTQNILGLVTKYGGVNSHMAIRCAELGIPAAIGCGEQLFERYLSCRELILDCSARELQVVV